MSVNNIFELGLTLIPGVGDGTAKQLISYCGSAENIFKSTRKKLLSIPGIGEKLADSIINQKVLKNAEEILTKAQKENAKILFYLHDDYPSRLKQIPDAPIILFCAGNADLNPRHCISIVGTRKATAYGREETEKLVAALTPYKPLVVSGLAYGIDIAAHKACIQHQIPTLGVMASGLDIIYPSVHKKTAQEMLSNGGLLTEYTFGTKPDAPRFPARNRIVAGISDAVIVIEAAASGGALITAELANGYDREVLALPGRVNDLYSSGCNKLISAHKAHIYNEPEDLIKLLGWDLSQAKTKKIQRPEDLSTEEVKIYELLQQNGDCQIDDLSWKSQLNISQTASILLTMEFKGLVKPLPGKKFKLA